MIQLAVTVLYYSILIGSLIKLPKIMIGLITGMHPGYPLCNLIIEKKEYICEGAIQE
jgi:hypothetical protein